DAEVLASRPPFASHGDNLERSAGRAPPVDDPGGRASHAVPEGRALRTRGGTAGRRGRGDPSPDDRRGEAQADRAERGVRPALLFRPARRSPEDLRGPDGPDPPGRGA